MIPNKEELVLILREQGKNVLADILQEKGTTTIEAYSKHLWNYRTNIPMETALKNAFISEFKRLHIPLEEHENILTSLEKYRSIQTAPHTGFHDSNRILTAHAIAVTSLPQDAYYVVGTFSGIPFGNDSYPCALSWSKQHTFKDILAKNDLILQAEKKQKDRERDVGDDGQYRLSLYSPKDRDSLVYRSKVNEIYALYSPHFSEKLQHFITQAQAGESFTEVMLTSYQALLRNVFPDKKIIALDINEVICSYMQEVLEDKTHFIYKMFFENETHQKVLDVFSTNEHFFYDTHIVNEKERSVHAYIENFLLKSQKDEKEITSETLQQLLKETKLCPGIFLGFTILAFMNGFQCFGSFKQIHYLTEYKETWMKHKFFAHSIEDVVTNSLTTGGHKDEEKRHTTAIDIALGTKWNLDPHLTLEDVLMPIENILRAFKK